MKLPWVWRSEHDAWRKAAENAVRHCDLLDAVCRRLEQRAERETVASEARYSELMVAYKQLKLQGFTQPTPELVREVPKADPVMQAVNQACRGDARVRSAMLQQVMRDREEDVPEIEIIERIHRGSRPAEEVS